MSGKSLGLIETVGMSAAVEAADAAMKSANVSLFEAACQSGWGGKPEAQTIRRLVTESEVAVAGNSKFRFVGADAFSPDELRTDLFSDDEGGYVDCVALDAALLEKLQAVAEHLREAEGWECCI